METAMNKNNDVSELLQIFKIDSDELGMNFLNVNEIDRMVGAVTENLTIPRNIKEAPAEINIGVKSECINYVGIPEENLLALIDLSKVPVKEEKSLLESDIQ
jgi:chemotaxis signal transduction protein